jgi:hypothetical protein
MNKQMKSLSHAKHTELVYLIKGSAYPWLYSKLSQILGEDEIRYFASVEIRQTEGRWSAFHGSDFVSYSGISEADREFIVDDLDYLHTVVRRKIASDSEMSRYVNELLLVPSQEQIFVYHEDSLPKITLAQWGCSAPRSRRGFDPLGLIIEERKKTHTMVDLSIRWTSGEPAANTRFKFSYKYSNLEKTTNTDGIARLGLLKNGLTFTVADIVEPASFEETLEVIPDQNLYKITVPYYTSVEVKVVDQLNRPVSDCDIRLRHNDDDNLFVSDKKGEFRIDRILHDNSPLILFLMPDCKINQEYYLKREHNRILFSIYCKITGNVRITVVRKLDDKPVTGHAIKIKLLGDEKEYISGNDGSIWLDALEIPTTFTVTDASDEYNHRDFTVSADGDEFVFPIEQPVVLAPSIEIVSRKDASPVGAYPLKVTIDGNEQILYSNRDGLLVLTDVRQGSRMLVTDANDEYNNMEFVVDIDHTEFIFPVELPEIFTQRIKVVNKADMTTLMDAYPVKVTINGNAQTLYSNRDGIILLGEMKKDVDISLTDANDPYNNVEFTTSADMQEYIFAVEPPAERMVKITLFDINKDIMPNHDIEVIINGVHYKKVTDGEGKISLPARLFTHGKKVKVEIPLTEDDTKKKYNRKKR